MNMMRNKKSGGGMKHRHGGGHGGGRRYNNNSSDGNNRGPSDHQNLSRQKHHASQMRDKFQTMASDALRSGERVEAEYFFQHVDHYMRVLADIAVIEAERFAHQREQQQAQQQTQTNDAGQEGDTNNGSDANPYDTQNAGEAERPQPPRRQQHRNPRPPRAYDQGAQNADAANSTAEQALPVPHEIALPASILSEIPSS
jgi:hypothetical protein